MIQSRSNVLLLSLLLFLFLASWNALSQESEIDSIQLLKVARINLSANNFALKPKVPTFEQFQSDFQFGNRFITSTLSEFSVDEFQATSFFSGFMVNFIFRSDLFDKKADHDREFFSAAFESGHTDIEMYRLITTADSRLSYTFSSDIFRITLGYRRILTKKDKRLKFYTGLEMVNEFNISAAIFEKQLDQNYEVLTSERKLFAKKGYNLYLNIPIGLDYRLFKKATLFFHLNTAFGSQNSDPLRLTGIYTGSRLGVSLKI